MPLFSFIVPCYNSSKTIKKCLDSIKCQTFHDFECILFNDGSTDETERILMKYVKNDSRFKYFFHKNSGTSVTTNECLFKSTGDYVVPIDHDDWVEPDLLEELSKILNYNRVDIIGFKSTFSHNNFIEKNTNLLNDFIVSFNDDDKYKICFELSRIYITHTATCIRRTLFDGVLFTGNGYGADSIVMRVIIKKSNNVAFLNKEMYHRLENPNSVSRKKQKANINFDIILRLEDYLHLWHGSYGPELHDFFEMFLNGRSNFFRFHFLIIKDMIKCGRMIFKYRKIFFKDTKLTFRTRILLKYPFIPIHRKVTSV